MAPGGRQTRAGAGPYNIDTVGFHYALPSVSASADAVGRALRPLPVSATDRFIRLERRSRQAGRIGRDMSRIAAPAERYTSGRIRGIKPANVGPTLVHRSLFDAAPSSAAEAYTANGGEAGYLALTDGAALQFRDVAPAEKPETHVPTPAPRPSREELVRQFGNLIEGADAGLTPSFEVGRRGISDAMAVIEQTAEKVAANSRLIEEVRERQREIESVTLKSSDMDAITEEMTRRLRSRIRLDRSRYSG